MGSIMAASLEFSDLNLLWCSTMATSLSGLIWSSKYTRQQIQITNENNYKGFKNDISTQTTNIDQNYDGNREKNNNVKLKN